MTTNKEHKKRIILAGGVGSKMISKPLGQLQWGGDNPGSLSVDFGGRSWDLSLNLAHQGYQVAFVSVAGKDFPGIAAKSMLAQMGVDTDFFILKEGQATAAEAVILNLLDQPEIFLGDQAVNGNLSPADVEGISKFFQEAEGLVLENCFGEDVLRILVDAGSGTRLIWMPDTLENAAKAFAYGRIGATLILDRVQAEHLRQKQVLSLEELEEAALWIGERTQGRVFILLGDRGLYYCYQGKGALATGTTARIQEIVSGVLEDREMEAISSNAVEERSI